MKKNNPVYSYLEFGNKFLNSVIKDKRKFLTYSLILIAFLSLIIKFTEFFLVILLILLGSISMLHVRISEYFHYIGIELCTMATVLTSLAYGPAVGAFTGAVSITTAFILSGYFKPTYFISVLSLPLIGILVPLLSHLPLLYLGLLMTLIYDAVVLPLYVIMGNSRIISSIIFFITHVMFNYWVFSTIAPFIYQFM